MNEKQENPKFCANCGQPWEPGSRFCGECGHAFDEAVSAAEKPRAAPAIAQEPVKDIVEKKRKPFTWRIPIIVFGILIIGLGLAYAGYVTHFFGLGQARKESPPVNMPVSLPQAKAPEPVPKKAKPVAGKKPANTFNKAMLAKYVESVRFFEGGSPIPPKPQRIYKEDFSAQETRYINWEMTLKHPVSPSRFAFSIEAVWRRPDGSIHARETVNTFIEPGWDNSWHASGWGSNRPGTWLAGEYYYVDYYVEGKQIAAARFRVF